MMAPAAAWSSSADIPTDRGAAASWDRDTWSENVNVAETIVFKTSAATR